MSTWRNQFIQAIWILLLVGCAGSQAVMTPPDSLQAEKPLGGSAQTHLWGYYEVYIDIESKEASIVPARTEMFTANIVQFLNNNPAGLTMEILSTPVTSTYVDIDLIVGIKHPFPSKPAYSGYDVRGVFVGYGDHQMAYNPELLCGIEGYNQTMLDDPENYDGGGPDGYTRWYNPSEFTVPGVFGYTLGIYASIGYAWSATLNPYKYFADGLGEHDDLWTFLETNSSAHGVFLAGSTNYRNYYIRFPVPHPNVKFGYSIIANWSGPAQHPSNAPEAVACSVEVTPDIYFEYYGCSGGDLILDVSLWDWDSEATAGVPMEDYQIWVESSVLSAPHQFTTSEMTPTGGGDHYSTYHVDITADTVYQYQYNYYWIIAECVDKDYGNPLGVPNAAGADHLAAFFKGDIWISPTGYDPPPWCWVETVTPMPACRWGKVAVEFDGSNSIDPPCYDGPLTFSWDFDGDWVFDEDPDDSFTGTSDHPVHEYTQDYSGDVWLKVVDQSYSDSYCSVSVQVDTTPPLLYSFDGTIDDGGMQVLDGSGWTFVDVSGCWDENGSQDTAYPASACTVLATPPINIPNDVSSVHLRMSHWGCVHSFTTYKDAGIMGYTLDDGSTYVWNRSDSVVFNYFEGTDFPLMYDDNLNAANFATCIPPVPVTGWQGECWSGYPNAHWGSIFSPVESDWTCDDLKGLNGVRFVFGFISDDGGSSIPGWSIRELDIYTIS
jgi:hypothetical protein